MNKLDDLPKPILKYISSFSTPKEISRTVSVNKKTAITWRDRFLLTYPEVYYSLSQLDMNSTKYRKLYRLYVNPNPKMTNDFDIIITLTNTLTGMSSSFVLDNDRTEYNLNQSLGTFDEGRKTSLVCHVYCIQNTRDSLATCLESGKHIELECNNENFFDYTETIDNDVQIDKLYPKEKKQIVKVEAADENRIGEFSLMVFNERVDKVSLLGLVYNNGDNASTFREMVVLYLQEDDIYGHAGFVWI